MTNYAQEEDKIIELKKDEFLKYLFDKVEFDNFTLHRYSYIQLSAKYMGFQILWRLKLFALFLICFLCSIKRWTVSLPSSVRRL